MIIDGKKVSNEIKEEIALEISKFNTKPCLAVIQIGQDEASNVYVKAKKSACEKVGMNFIHVNFTDETEENEIISKINELNADKNVNGIIVQLPIPLKFDQDKIINTIDKDKDVDGLTDYNCSKLYKNDANMIPCTPLGIMYLLKYYDIELKGKNVTIVGKSNLVGKPLAMLLLDKGATVTICHSKTIDLKEHTSKADILIVAVGKKHLIKEDMVKDNAVVIDVGINREDGKLYGDVDFENVVNRVTITPVPGGVGPMTVAMLLNNVLKNYKKSI